jgi:glutamyl-tRNA synthetase
MKDSILRHALVNAVEHEGKADIQAVIGKIIAEDPGAKNKIKEIIGDVKKIVKEVNSLSLKDQQKKVNGLGIKIEKKKIEDRHELPDLPEVRGKVITAFPPEPSKFPHLGHAKAALLNFLYAKKYGGKFIVRFEDSNPELVKKEYYDALIDGLDWLGIKWDELDYLSDHMPEYYETIESLIKKGFAYVCLCKQETIKQKRASGEGCEHRDQSPKENLELWKKMLKGLKEGEVSVRLKIDMEHQNALMRDPSIARINEFAHPRTKNKYRVWPIYDFGTAMLDIWEKVTHRVRSKEFEIRKELQQHIQKILGFEPPYITEMGRFNLKGVPSSGRIIREMIKKKELMGWDDPRLTSLIALRRRGFTPEAIKQFLISTGLTKTEALLDWDPLEAENRKMIDPIANRYFAVSEPVEIKIEGAPKIKEVEAPVHPDFPKKGKRKLKVGDKIFIEKEDLKNLEGKEVRLMDLYNVRLGKKSKFVDRELRMELPKIQWVSEPNVKIKIIMSDGSVRSGIAETNVKDLKKDELIQLMRIGFCRVDSVRKETVLYFTHK